MKIVQLTEKYTSRLRLLAICVCKEILAVWECRPTLSVISIQLGSIFFHSPLKFIFSMFDVKNCLCLKCINNICFTSVSGHLCKFLTFVRHRICAFALITLITDKIISVSSFYLYYIVASFIVEIFILIRTIGLLRGVSVAKLRGYC